MSAKDQTMDVSLLGRDYRIACTDEERPALQQAVAYVDRKMQDIRDSTKTNSVERIAVMAALNITHELLSAKLPGNVELGEVKRRIQSMQAALDAAVAQQDKLF